MGIQRRPEYCVAGSLSSDHIRRSWYKQRQKQKRKRTRTHIHRQTHIYLRRTRTESYIFQCEAQHHKVSHDRPFGVDVCIFSAFPVCVWLCVCTLYVSYHSWWKHIIHVKFVWSEAIFNEVTFMCTKCRLEYISIMWHCVCYWDENFSI